MRLAGTARAERDVVLRVLSAFESAVRNETDDLDARLESLRGLSSAVEVFALGDAALQRSIGLSYLDLDLQPFDQSILAGILTRASELRAAGATDLSFCEADRDLQPWPGREVRSAELKRLYDEVGLWVYQDFTLSEPARPSGWTCDAEPA